ncbi:MAG: tRNA lysidine(34) synthetase TilS [Ilumatobacteraceae bacterium]
MVCAVSGGADSLALMALAVAASLNVTAVHVDHRIRPDSNSESTRVEHAARALGAAFQAVTADVGPGPNLEARARSARYAALPPDVLTGHTADDVAETVILNLLRGAGLDGLSGMRAVGGPSGRVRHPLLGIRRSDTERLCSFLGWEPLQDPSNLDPSILRNRVRREILPQLGLAAGRDLVPILCRQAALMADEADILDTLSEAIDPTDARQLAAAPVALARRAIRRWLTGEHPPDAATVERVLAVARGEAVACEIPGGRRVTRSHQRLTRH